MYLVTLCDHRVRVPLSSADNIHTDTIPHEARRSTPRTGDTAILSETSTAKLIVIAVCQRE